jgi:lipopolysaccharide transport system permease protein
VSHLVELWNHRELLWLWTQRQVRVRYKQSVLGIAWAILQPAALALVFSVVFSYLARLPSDGIPYPLFAYSALVPWTFFSTSLSQGIPSVVGQMNLVTKTAFPREILPLGTIGASLLDFLCSFSVFILMLLFYRVPVSSQVLWLAALILIQVMLATGIVLIGATLNVFYRDIRFAIPLLTQIWMFATPIVYPASMVPERFRSIYALNPMVGVIESYRNIFIRGQGPEWSSLGMGIASTVGILVVGYSLFKKLDPQFADII